MKKKISDDFLPWKEEVIRIANDESNNLFNWEALDFEFMEYYKKKSVTETAKALVKQACFEAWSIENS